MKLHAVVALMLCAALSACTDTADPLGVDPVDGTLMTRLQAPTTLDIDAEASLMALTATTDQSQDAMPIQFTIVDGAVDVRATPDGDVVVQAFSFALEDQSIGAEAFPPSGLELRDMTVRMEYPVVATPEWTTTTASAEIPIDVTADWSAVFNGNTYSLRSIELSGLVVQADMTLVDGEISAQVSGARGGTFWDWADRFTMADLVVEVDARSAQ